MSNVLILGGAGYLGGALTELVNQKYDIDCPDEYIVFDCLLYPSLHVQPNIKFVKGDIRNNGLLKKYLDWCDVVVFLAALVGDGAGALTPEATREINTDRVKFVAENCGEKRIIFCSSASCYGVKDGISDENSELNPISLYAKTKIEAENILKGRNAIVNRLGTLYGASSYGRIRLDLIINTMSAHAYYNKKIKVMGGEQYRPVLHVKDAARAIFLEIKSVKRGIYNLCSQNVQIINLAYQIKSHFPDTILEILDIPAADLRNYRVDCSKARKELSFNPIHTIDDAVIDLKFLFQSGLIENWQDSKYHNWNYLKEFQNHVNIIENKKQ